MFAARSNGSNLAQLPSSPAIIPSLIGVVSTRPFDDHKLFRPNVPFETRPASQPPKPSTQSTFRATRFEKGFPGSAEIWLTMRAERGGQLAWEGPCPKICADG